MMTSLTRVLLDIPKTISGVIILRTVFKSTMKAFTFPSSSSILYDDDFFITATYCIYHCEKV